MRAKPLWQYGLSDLTLELVSAYLDEGLEETQHLEFKRDGYRRSDGERKELLRDVTAMVNGGGGLLLLGVEEDGGGRARAVVGIEEPDLQVERILRSVNDGVEERILGLDARVVPVARRRALVAVRCPRSLRAPHMVTGQGDYRFWRRHGTDKTKMRLSDLRDAFRRSTTVTEELLRNHRLRVRELVRATTAPTLALTLAPYGTPREVLDIFDLGLRRTLSSPSADPRVGAADRPGSLVSAGGGHDVAPTLAGLAVRPSHRRWELELGRDGHFFLWSDSVTRAPRSGGSAAWLCPETLCHYAASLVALAREVFAHVGVGGPFVIGLDLVHVEGMPLPSEVNGAASAGVVPAAGVLKPAPGTRLHVPTREVAALDGVPHPAFEVLRRLWNAFEHERPPRQLFDGQGRLS